MHRIDGAGHTLDNKFTQGNPSTGIPATQVTADWLNSVQEEVIAVLTAAGLSPVKASTTQLRDAIVALIAGGGAAPAAAAVTIVDAGDFFPVTNVEDALQLMAYAIYATTFAASRVRRTPIALAGAAFQTEAAHAENPLELTNATDITYLVRADADLNLDVGSTITLFQAGAGQIVVSAAGGVTIDKGVSFHAKSMEQHTGIVLVKMAANRWRLAGQLEAA